jgi:hypothetical protein
MTAPFSRSRRTAYQLGSQPVVADRHEAWCLTDNGWRMLEENEAFMETVAVTDPQLIKQYAYLPSLPVTAFSSYRTVH